MRRNAVLATLGVLALAMLQPVVGRAQQGDGVEEARTYFNVGARAYAAGQFLDAVRAFEQAYKLTPRDGLLFSIAQAYRKQYYVDKQPEHLRAAIQHYRDYLSHVAQGGRRGEAAEALAELEPRATNLAEDAPKSEPEARSVTQIMVSSPTPGVHISLDGRTAGTLPFVSDVKPGKHHIVLTAPGYLDFIRDVSLLEGSVIPLDVPLADRPARVEVQAPSGARISIDGKEVGFAPLSPFDTAPGRHLVTASANGRQAWAREVDLGRGSTTRVDVRLTHTGQRTASWILMGAGATGFVASGVLAFTAAHKQSGAQAILDRRKTGNISSADLDEYASLRDQRDTFRTASLVVGGAGAALVVVGFGLFAFDEPRASTPAESEKSAPRGPAPGQPQAPAMEISAAPVVLPGVAGVAARGRF